MSSQITNDTLYITNADTINEIYSLIQTALSKSKGSKTVQLSTKAGDFLIKKTEAEDSLRRLEELDRSDSTERKKDGKIARNTFLKSFGERLGAGLIKHGFKIDFTEFRPSKLWLSNYSPIEQYAADGNFLTSGPGRQLGAAEAQQMVWRYVTTATLSGITPDRFQEGKEFCSLDFGCKLYLALHGDDPFGTKVTIDEKGSIRQRMRWNLSFDIHRRNELCAYFVHERGHGIYKKIAHDKGYKEFGLVMRSWMSTQPQYQQVANEYFGFFDRQPYGAAPYYIVEELTDPMLIKQLDPSLLSEERQKWLHFHLPSTNLSQENFDQSVMKESNNNTPHEMAIFLANRVHRGEACGVQKVITDRLKTKIEIYLGSKDKGALALFRTTLQLGKAAAEYASSPEFKAFIDQNIPPSFKNRKK